MTGRQGPVRAAIGIRHPQVLAGDADLETLGPLGVPDYARFLSRRSLRLRADSRWSSVIVMPRLMVACLVV